MNTLVILAAGEGTRFGGLKQIAPVTSREEAIAEFSVFDAGRAGFERFVFVVSPGSEEKIKNYFSKKIGDRFEVRYAIQESPALPRKKPWGTAHALLAARELVDAPFAMINADDFYGKRAYETASDAIETADQDSFSIIAYNLSSTLSRHGGVSRGICSVDSGGYLNSAIECKGILRENDLITYDAGGEMRKSLPEDSLVSMNFWIFTPTIFDHLARSFETFRCHHSSDVEELYLNSVVDQAILDGYKVKVLKTDERWLGVTYKEDSNWVSAEIERLREKGDYPDRLFDGIRT